MLTASGQHKGITERLLALLLSLWLGGAGCLSACALMASAAQAQEPVASTEHCEAKLTSAPAAASSKAAHACCHRARKAAPSKTADNSSTAFSKQSQQKNTGGSHCPLARPTAEAASKPRLDTERAATVVQVSLAFIQPSSARVVSPSARLWHPPRGDTHLRCCVFLI